MKLTTKGRYAVTAMLDLALHYHGQPVVLAEIAERQCLSLAYLEQLFCRLRRAGLVKSCRGPGGGYAPGRPLGEISVAAVLAAAEEPLQVTRCGGAGDCQDGQPCLAHELWCELENHLDRFLASVNLADLAARHRRSGDGWKSLRHRPALREYREPLPK
ncbi:MAG TPA: Rrf2 family transcriptional regulator [Candidatus Competibacteraceae bacterium]|nr:Rrf2 family transcriptional regulator [Candidatus Competibacteraceae bacterium]